MKMNQEHNQQDRPGLDRQNNTRINQLHSAEENKPLKENEESTSTEIIATHHQSEQPEGVDEQFGGDQADNRDEANTDDDLI